MHERKDVYWEIPGFETKDEAGNTRKIPAVPGVTRNYDIDTGEPLDNFEIEKIPDGAKILREDAMKESNLSPYYHVAKDRLQQRQKAAAFNKVAKVIQGKAIADYLDQDPATRDAGDFSGSEFLKNSILMGDMIRPDGPAAPPRPYGKSKTPIENDESVDDSVIGHWGKPRRRFITCGRGTSSTPTRTRKSDRKGTTRSATCTTIRRIRRSTGCPPAR